MLPSKRLLRKITVKKVPKWVKSYFCVEDSCTQVIEFACKNISGQRVLVAYWYLKDTNNCDYVTYVAKDGDILTRTTSTPIKWYCSNLCYLRFKKESLYISSEKVNQFFGTDEKGIYALTHSVMNFKEKRKNERRKLKCAQSHLMWEGLTEQPKDFLQWCKDEMGYDAVFGVDDRHHAYCTACNSEFVSKSKLIMGHTYRCPHCHKELKAITDKKVKAIQYKCFEHLSLLGDKVVVRHYDLCKHINLYTYSEHSFPTKFRLWEYERTVITGSRSYDYYIHRSDWSAETTFWQPFKPYMGFHICWMLPNRYYEEETVYTKNLSDISECLSDRKSELLCFFSKSIRAEDLIVQKDNLLNVAEILYKAGYSTASKEVVYADSEKSLNINVDATTPGKILGMNKEFREHCKQQQFDLFAIKVMRSFYDFSRKLQDFIDLYDYTELQVRRRQIINYGRVLFYIGTDIEKNIESIINICKKYSCTVRQILKYLSKADASLYVWLDYIYTYETAAELAGMQVEKPKKLLFPSYKLQSAHDNAVKWLTREREKQKKVEAAKNVALLKKISENLSSLDDYILDGMCFKIPHTEADFIKEGTNQKICVGNGTYYKAMASGKSVVCFMRKKEDSDKSYITVEYQIDGCTARMVQCHLAKNKQASDEEKSIAKKYGKLLTKRLMQLQKTA